MSEEKFKRCESGGSDRDLHKHGGLDAREDKTERENLEEAIEALNDSEETENLVDIEKDMKGEDIEEIAEQKVEEVEAEPEEEPSDDVKAAIEELENDVAKEPITMPSKKEEPVNSWKTKAENRAYMTIDTIETPKEKKKCGAGWKFATVFFLLLAVAGCGAAAYLFFTNGKTELMGRTVESYETGKKKSSKSANSSTKNEEFDAEKNLIDVATLNKVTSDPALKVKKLEYSADGNYLIAFMTDSSAYGIWYKKVEKGSTWTMLQGGQALTGCSDYTEEQKKLMNEFKTFDDDLDSNYIGCYPDETKPNTTYPE